MTDRLEPMDPFELALRRRMLAAGDRVLRPFDPLAITDAAAGSGRVGPARRSSQMAARRWLLVAAVVTVVAATLFGLAIAARPQLPVTPTPAPSALALASLQPSLEPSAQPSPSPSQGPTPPTPPASSAPTPTPSIAESDGQLTAGSTYLTRGFGMLFTFALPRDRDPAVATIPSHNNMTIEWGRLGPSLGSLQSTGRLTLLDHAPVWTDVCHWGSDTGVVWPVTPAETIAWLKRAFGSRAVRRPSLVVDGRSVAVFDITPGACDPFAQKGDQDLAAAPFHRVYVIPSAADTILAYTALFDRSGVVSVADPLIESIHFQR
jgi:hypothetical protein